MSGPSCEHLTQSRLVTPFEDVCVDDRLPQLHLPQPAAPGPVFLP